MKFLHTADWHLGKLLVDRSRLKEQKKVLHYIVELVRKHEVDVIGIAGDIYDNGNPSAAAVELFCDTVHQIAQNGKRLVVIIAGNHDKPERLTGLLPLAKSQGIVIIGTPTEEIESGRYGDYQVKSLGRGCFEVEIKGETVRFGCLPYTSEKSLGEVFYQDITNEESHLKSYEEKMASLYEEIDRHYREDTINILMSHVFTAGYKGDKSERSTQLGGSYLLQSFVFPKKADYIALGHVHKPQTVGGTEKRARYSGAILPYHSDEIKTPKQCNLVTFEDGKRIKTESLLLPDPKPIERWFCNSYEEAVAKCTENAERECWVFLTIRLITPLLEDQIRKLKEIKADILEIVPDFSGKDRTEEEREQLRQEENVIALFRQFYESSGRGKPNPEMMKLLAELTEEEE